MIRYYEWNYEWNSEARPRFAYYPQPETGLEFLRLNLGIPILLIVLGWLTFSNFKHAHQNWKFWARNIMAIVAVFVCVPILAKLCYAFD